MNKHICVISEGYPYQGHAYFTFVKQLCVALANLGWKVTVISPISITKILIRNNFTIPPKYRIEKTDSNNSIEIFSPRMLTVGNLCRFPILYRLMMRLRQNAISHIIEKLPNKVDVLYGHFWHSAYAAYKIAKKKTIPLFVASGEAEIELYKYYSGTALKPFVNYVSGVICVSSKNKTESIVNKLTNEQKCVVIPNAIDPNLFYKKNKTMLRERLGFGQDDFITAFVGGFIQRKGAKRISEAITELKDKDIKSIFIGRLPTKDTSELPVCDGILFRGSLSHENVLDYLNAADVFVMPTLHEGCCNANIEALACGLPVISSDKEFNYDILDDSCSILINPMDISAISNAISYLKNNRDVLNKMSENALIKAAALNIESRAKRITDFIITKCK